MAGRSLDPSLVQFFAEQCWLDAHSRLLEAGADAERGLWLPDIFVDLNVASCRHRERYFDEARLLDPRLISDRIEDTSDTLRGIVNELCSSTCSLPSRFVLLGGPGSGKSAITSMVQLLLRVGMLPTDAIDEERRARVAPIIERATKRVPSAVRDIVPIRVVLPRLARFLSEQPAGGLGAFFANESARIAKNCEVRAEVFERFVAESPTVLWLFDGLDEVPQSAGRATLIEHAMKWVREGDSMLVTTRPQAYVNELDSLRAFIVQDLDDDAAVTLGRALVPHWVVGDPSAASERTAKIEALIRHGEAKELATSPLQVLLLSIAIARSGDLPRLRATLFQQLFDVLFDRECAKPHSVVKRDDRGVFAAIHRRTGIALQVRGEARGGTAAVLTAKEFLALIVDVLVRDFSLSEDEAGSRAAAMMNFAVDRLVLLERSSDREFSFAVRSIQEFFAADAIVDHPDAPMVTSRVAALAAKPYWMNTVALVASHAVAMTKAREMPIAKAATLGAIECEHRDDPLLAMARPGAWIAETQLRERGVASTLWIGAAWSELVPELSWFLLRASESQRAELAPAIEAEIRRRMTLDDVAFEVSELLLRLFDESPDRYRILLREWLETHAVHFEWPGPFSRETAGCFEPGDSVPAIQALQATTQRLIELRREDGVGSVVVRTIAAHRAVRRTVDAWTLTGPLASFAAAVFAFCDTPTSDSLARALREAKPKLALLKPIADGLVWPIAACIMWSDNEADIDGLIADCCVGRLGNPDLWAQFDQAIERNQDDDIHSVVDLARPLDLENGRILFAPNKRREVALPTVLRLGDFSPLALRDLTSDARMFIEHHPVSFALALSLPLRHAQDTERLLNLVNIEVGREERDAFIEWADARGRAGSHFAYRIQRTDQHNQLAQLVADALERKPEAVGLWNALRALAVAGAQCDFVSLATLPRPTDELAIDHHIVAVIGGWESLASDEPTRVVMAIASYLSNTDRWSPRLEELALALRPSAKLPSHQDALAHAARNLIALRPMPVFATPERWARYEWAGKFPAVRGPRPPVVLKSIDVLENVRVFAKTPVFDAPLPKHEPAEGQWIVVIGENGSGKTTFLRALAFALATPAASTQLVVGHPSFIRNGGDGLVGVTTESTSLRVRLRRNEKGTLTFTDEVEPQSVRPWVVGYGVKRGAGTGEPDRKPLYDETGSLASLFDQPFALTNTTSFLSRCDHNALSEERKLGRRDGPKNRLWNELRAAMQSILNVHSIEVDDGVWVRVEKDGPRVAFDMLSHGYLSMAGWVSDLVARWLERIEETDDEYPANILATMSGIVLVDEIDLHLHPRWQLTVIDDLRRLFPRLTFIATTHNPLTLHGARDGEIFVLTRDESGAPVFHQRDIRPGSDVDRVLFDVFGVHQTFDKATRELLEAHRAMVQRGASPDDPDRIALEAQLRSRLGAIGDLVSEQRNASEFVADDAMRALAEDSARRVKRRASGKDHEEK